MKNRGCPYCHETISLKRCMRYLLLGTDHYTVCNHCNRSVRLAKEPKPGFKYSFMFGFLSIYVPMQVSLLFFHTTFLEALLYSLPLFVVVIAVASFLTLRTIFFTGDI